MFRLKEAIVLILALSMLIQSVSAISNIKHSVDGNKITLTYQGTPPFWINIRGDTNIGQNSGYLWAKTSLNSFTYDAGLTSNPSKKFYYGVKDTSWSQTSTFTIGEIDNCHQTQYKMLFVLATNNASELTADRIAKLNEIKANFENAFQTATYNLAHMDTSYPVVTIVDNGTLFYDLGNFQASELTKKLYQTYPDDFDFITVFTTLHLGMYQYHLPITNQIFGIGLSIRDGSEDYGSNGKLLGLNYMNEIDMYYPNDYRTYNGILHELGHQWCCYVGNDFAKGSNGAQLEIIQQGIHFYRGLESPSKTGDPMDSDYWVPNGDGSYKRNNSPGDRIYHPFQLYFMGLLTDENDNWSKNYTIFNAGIVGQDFNELKAYPYKNVSIQDIIAVAGERGCEPTTD